MNALVSLEKKAGRGISTIVGGMLSKESMESLQKFVSQTNIFLH